MACYICTFFPPLFFSFHWRDKIREIEEGDFSWLRIVGVGGGLFLSGSVNGKMPQPLLSGAVESSYVDS